MSKEERTEVAEQVLSELRQLPYDACRSLIENTSNRIIKQAEKTFQVEVDAFWDDRKRQTVHVMVAVSEPGLSDFVPTMADFIISPDGTFVGEGRRINAPKG